MRPVCSLLLCLLFASSAFVSGYRGYRSAERAIEADLQQALTQMLAQRAGLVVTPDTVRTCRRLAAESGGAVAVSIAHPSLRRYLTIGALRGRAWIACAVADGEAMPSAPLPLRHALRSDTLFLETPASDEAGAAPARERLAVRCYADCSPALVLRLSDQRATFALAAAALFWLSLACYGGRRRLVSAFGGLETGGTGFGSTTPIYIGTAAVPAAPDARLETAEDWGGLTYDTATNRFLTATREPLRLTPMQARLLEMFRTAPAHRLTHAEICTALWPKKDDPSETLYALIRRLKVRLEAETPLTIEAERARAYIVRAAREGNGHRATEACS